ncbi:F0F1 ATP synthase subunit delta [Patescibacteria group bacterium]|nr:F0F1 ATP synthase subunit delta [Patescibacteria group bacterium]
MKDTYVHALLELIQSGQPIDTVLMNLTKVLASRGHSKLHGSILNDLMHALELAQENSLPKVTVAKEGSVSEAEIKAALVKLSVPHDEYKVTYNPNIIGGLIATYQSKQLDQSYQTKLRELYQSIITT